MFTEDMIVGGGTVLNPKPETYSDFVRMLDDIENFISQELDRAREEGRRELLDSIIEGVAQLKDLVSMFNPMSPEIRAKQSGEIEAYNGLLEKLSKLTTK